MRVKETTIPGAFAVVPSHIPDVRGTFYEGLRADELESAVGRPFVPRQINYSVSHRNTLRGLHGVTVPPGQVKYVSCVRGAVRDFIVDLRIGSPTFGRYESTALDADSGHAVYIPDGVAHGFLTLTDDACVCYVLSTLYVPGTQIDINPLDPDLAVPWGFTEPPVMSEKDTWAPNVSDILASGLLPRWEDVR